MKMSFRIFRDLNEKRKEKQTRQTFGFISTTVLIFGLRPRFHMYTI